MINLLLQIYRCAKNEFDCAGDSGQCISRKLTCNGIKECVNGSDEDVEMCS